MVLDEKNRQFYLDDKIIKLTYLENQILSILINNKDIYKYVPFNMFNSTNIHALRTTIYRLNEKIKPYLKIVSKNKFGYKIIICNYKLDWKRNFLVKNNYYELINIYKEIQETEAKLTKLKNKLKTIEKNII